MVTFLVYILKSSFCLVLLYGFYRLLLASTTRFSLNRWVLIGGMLACLLLPFVSLELEREPIFQAPLRLVEEWEQPVLGITEVGVAKISQEKTEFRGLVLWLCWFTCQELLLSFFDGLLAISVCSTG